MSNETKHTPGPWTVCIGSSGATIYPDNNANHPLVLHFEWSDEPGNGALIMEAQANAALIARAPDLLAENEALRAQVAELRAALKAAMVFSHDDEGEVWSQSAIAKCRAALAKVTL